MNKCVNENYNPATVEYYSGPTQYEPPGKQNVTNLVRNTDSINDRQVQETIINTTEAMPFCNDQVTIDPVSDFATGMNQRLAGGQFGGKYRPNPKTLIAPVLAPRTHDLDYWRDDNLITHSAINSEPVQQDMYASGYVVSNCCGYDKPNYNTIPRCNKGSYEGYKHDQIFSPQPTVDRKFVPTIEGYKHDQIFSPQPTVDRKFVPTIEGYEEPRMNVRPNEPGMVNTACGYNPKQIYRSGLPSNLASGNCEQSPAMKQYNNNLHTQIITPGVYTTNQINEPINSNIGISFQQQFEPTTCRQDENGLHYTQHDPRVFEPVIDNVPEKPHPTYDNVYDPRFYGYGTSYRSYEDEVTGQTRFMYDDINAIRMPNYITRNKLDHLPYADSYGPMQQNGEYGNPLTSNIRELAQESWLTDSLDFRNDMTERQMRKNNSIAWQKRQNPHGARQANSYKC